MCYHSSFSTPISFLFKKKKRKKRDNPKWDLTSDTQQGHRSGILCNSSSKADEPSVSLQPSCTALIQPESRKYRLLSPFITPCHERCATILGGPEGLRDDRHWQRPTNYRLKSGRAGRLLCSIQGLQWKVGILKTRQPHADVHGLVFYMRWWRLRVEARRRWYYFGYDLYVW